MTFDQDKFCFMQSKDGRTAATYDGVLYLPIDQFSVSDRDLVRGIGATPVFSGGYEFHPLAAHKAAFPSAAKYIDQITIDMKDVIKKFSSQEEMK